MKAFNCYVFNAEEQSLYERRAVVAKFCTHCNSTAPEEERQHHMQNCLRVNTKDVQMHCIVTVYPRPRSRDTCIYLDIAGRCVPPGHLLLAIEHIHHITVHISGFIQLCQHVIRVL